MAFSKAPEGAAPSNSMAGQIRPKYVCNLFSSSMLSELLPRKILSSDMIATAELLSTMNREQDWFQIDHFKSHDPPVDCTYKSPFSASQKQLFTALQNMVQKETLNK
jgi:hypothetical protein